MAEARRWWSPELRATLYYSTVFMTSGATAAYGGIWFQDQGLSSGEIGLIGSVPVFIMLVLNLLVGRIADREQQWPEYLHGLQVAQAGRVRRGDVDGEVVGVGGEGGR